MDTELKGDGTGTSDYAVYTYPICKMLRLKKRAHITNVTTHLCRHLAHIFYNCETTCVDSLSYDSCYFNTAVPPTPLYLLPSIYLCLK